MTDSAKNPPTTNRLNLRQWLAVVSALGLSAFVFFHTVIDRMERLKYWNSLQSIKEKCGLQVLDVSGNQKITDVARPQQYSEQILIPYRRNSNDFNMPKYKKGQVAFVNCVLPSESLDPNLPILLNFGPVAGEVAALANGQILSHENEANPWIVYIPPQVWPKELHLDFRFRNHNRDILPGPGKYFPVTWTQKTSDSVKQIERAFSDRNSEYFVRIGHNIALLICFSIIFAFGFSYADIGWLTLSLVLSSVATLSFFTDFSRSSNPLANIDWCINLLGNVALSSAVLHFTRKSGIRPIPWIASFVILTSFIIYEFAHVRIGIHVYPNYIGNLYMIMVGVACYRSRRTGPPLRRICKGILAITMFCAGIFNIWQSIWGREFITAIIYPVQMSIASLFGMMLAADLVMFRKRLLKSEGERLESIKARSDLENNIRLAKAFQSVVLGPGEVESFEWLTVTTKTMESNIVSGDWVQIYAMSPTKVAIYAGDVVGKGPQAALSAATIVGTLSALNSS